MQSAQELAEPARKRLRTSHACDLCRSRKIRCDGNNPCAACVAADSVCTYGSEANSRGKSELILDGVMRVERLLHEMNANIALITPSFNGRIGQTILPPILESQPPRSSFPKSPVTDQGHPFNIHPANPRRTSFANPANPENLENAVLETWHTSTTEAVLQWAHFDALPTLRDDYIPIFQLEQSRAPLAVKPGIGMFHFLTQDEVDGILDSFSQTINFWYPTMSLDQIRAARHLILPGDDRRDRACPETLLALLIMALGCASQVVGNLFPSSSGLQDSTRHAASVARARARAPNLSMVFFSSALNMIYVAHTTPSSISTHCLFFTAMYFAYLRRPLQAWEYISSAASKCMLFLSYPAGPTTPIGDGSPEQDMERIRRIFWACYILESDYLAELSSLPLSGIARIESSVPLPGATPGVKYRTQADEEEGDLSSCYFLACISMRRLLNRVHQLLYARETGAGQDRARFAFVVAELSSQLEEWRDVLPGVFKFEVAPLGTGLDHTKDPVPSGGGGGSLNDILLTPTEELGAQAKRKDQQESRRRFLRQRYLTCRSVIYRPYLMWMLNGGSAPIATPAASISSPGSGHAANGAPAATSPSSTTSPVTDIARERHFQHDMLHNTKACLDACLLHILSLRGFAQTVMVDTWICSLSMAGAMLVLLAAVRIPALRNLIGPEVLAAGDHLRGLLEEWQRVLGEPSSPSVDQSLQIIAKADRFIKEAYHQPAGLGSPGQVGGGGLNGH